jgi:hypothetical protein
MKVTLALRTSRPSVLSDRHASAPSWRHSMSTTPGGVQGRLIRLYDDMFSALETPIAQVLLSRANVMDRTQFLNATNTMTELLNLGNRPWCLCSRRAAPPRPRWYSSLLPARCVDPADRCGCDATAIGARCTCDALRTF